MSKCTECGQEKPRTFKGGDIVQSRQRPELFGIIPSDWLANAFTARYGESMRGQRRVVMLTGAMKGNTVQWSESRMDVVTGVFQVRARQ